MVYNHPFHLIPEHSVTQTRLCIHDVVTLHCRASQILENTTGISAAVTSLVAMAKSGLGKEGMLGSSSWRGRRGGGREGQLVTVRLRSGRRAMSSGPFSVNSAWDPSPWDSGWVFPPQVDIPTDTPRSIS